MNKFSLKEDLDAKEEKLNKIMERGFEKASLSISIKLFSQTIETLSIQL